MDLKKLSNTEAAITGRLLNENSLTPTKNRALSKLDEFKQLSTTTANAALPEGYEELVIRQSLAKAKQQGA